MNNENEFQQLKKQYPEFFKEASDKLVKLVISPETASQITDICLKNNIEEEDKIEKISYYISFVLLSNLPPETLSKTLEKNLQLKPEIAEKISREVNQIIFSSVKNDLDKLYPKMISIKSPDKTKKLSPSSEKSKKPPRKDTYREPIE